MKNITDSRCRAYQEMKTNFCESQQQLVKSSKLLQVKKKRLRFWLFLQTLWFLPTEIITQGMCFNISHNLNFKVLQEACPRAPQNVGALGPRSHPACWPALEAVRFSPLTDCQTVKLNTLTLGVSRKLIAISSLNKKKHFRCLWSTVQIFQRNKTVERQLIVTVKYPTRRGMVWIRRG